MSTDILVVKLAHFDEDLPLPFYATEQAAGADVCASLKPELRKVGLMLQPWQRVLVPTGLAVEIPEGYELQVRARSGLSYKSGLMLANGLGTIDSDYRGELQVLMVNLSAQKQVIDHGLRVAQLVLVPVLQAQYRLSSQLSESLRDQAGFGSTGMNAKEHG